MRIKGNIKRSCILSRGFGIFIDAGAASTSRHGEKILQLPQLHSNLSKRPGRFLLERLFAGYQEFREEPETTKVGVRIIREIVEERVEIGDAIFQN